MRTIIAGSRSIEYYPLVKNVLDRRQHGMQSERITQVVSGMCPNGVDQLGLRWARENGIPVEPFPADWVKYGKRAGMLRNKDMAQYAECCIIFWDSESPGSKNMWEEAKEAHKDPSYRMSNVVLYAVRPQIVDCRTLRRGLDFS